MTLPSSQKPISESDEISLSRRLWIYAAVWLFAAIAFAVAPFPSNDYPEIQERIDAFFCAPMMVAAGLACVTKGLLFYPAFLYFLVHAAFTLSSKHRRLFFTLCFVHFLVIVFALVCFVRWNYADQV